MSETPKPKRRWMPILLAASLALNLLIVGVALGTFMRVKGSDHAKAPPGFGSALYRALPKSERTAMRSDLSGLRKEGSRHRSKDFAVLSQALRTVPFDPAAVEVLLTQQARASAELQGALQGQWLARVIAMSDAERALYADRLDEVTKRGRHWHKKKD
nr:periplasmic heavy metal sensor [uncultured Ruegeria sp.]